MAEGFEVETKVPEDISTVAADFGAEMIDFDGTTHDAAFVQFEVDTDSSFPDPTQLSDEVDIGLFAQNNEVFKRGRDLMPDTDQFVRAQAENVVYSDETLFSTAAQESEGFIIDVSNNDLDNAITSELAVTPMANFDESASNLLKHPDVVSNFWSLDQATQNFWDAGSFSGSSTEGVWSRDIDFSDASQLVFDVKGDLPVDGYGGLNTTLTESQDSVLGVAFDDGFIAYGEGSFGDENVYVHDTSDFSLETTLTESQDGISSVAFGDGFIAYGSNDTNVYVHDMSDFSLETTLTESPSRVRGLAFGDGFIAYGEDSFGDGNVYVHDMSDFSLETTLTDPTDGLRSVAFSDGFIAYGGSDDNVYVHDTSDFSLETTLTESTATVLGVAFGDGFIAYGSNGGDVYVHDSVGGTVPFSVKVDNQNIFEESIGSDTFVEESADISSFSSVQQLELLISEDIDPSVFESSFGVGATGNGNSFIISNPDANFGIEFSDIRLQ